jgi:hypothetical protein
MSTSRNFALRAAQITTKFLSLERFLTERHKYVSRIIVNTCMTYRQMDSCHVSSHKAQLVVIKLKDLSKFHKSYSQQRSHMVRYYIARNVEGPTRVLNIISVTSPSQNRMASKLVLKITKSYELLC